MPYTVKATTRWADSTLDTSKQIEKIRDLFANDFVSTKHDPMAVASLRHSATYNGDMLARGSVISADGTEITTTTVWKSEAAYKRFAKHPAMKAYKAAMLDAGWDVTIKAV